MYVGVQLTPNRPPTCPEPYSFTPAPQVLENFVDPPMLPLTPLSARVNPTEPKFVAPRPPMMYSRIWNRPQRSCR